VIAANSPDRHVDAARGLRLLLSNGSDDQVPLTRCESQRFAGLLRAAGVPVTVRTVPGGRHDLAYVRGECPAVIAFLAAGWPP
jgi:acetyl esterase/lipase